MIEVEERNMLGDFTTTAPAPQGVRRRGVIALCAAAVAIALLSSTAAFATPAHAETPSPATSGFAPGTWHTEFRLDDARHHVSPDRPDIAARQSSSGPLLVFFPATNAAPSDYRAFLATAASSGYHVLGLDYVNTGRTLHRTCRHHPACYLNVQRNRLDGRRGSHYSHILAPNGILSRLREALIKLHLRDPFGGWESYLSHNQVAWNRIVVAGHSQGGSEAAYIAHREHVLGALMFGAPALSDGRTTASWIGSPGKTPSSDLYALAHVHDVLGRSIRHSWHALGRPLSARPVTVGDGVPAGNPHTLLTNIRVPRGASAHGVVVSDKTLRTSKGVPELRPVWRWMLDRFTTAAPHATPTAVPATRVGRHS